MTRILAEPCPARQSPSACEVAARPKHLREQAGAPGLAQQILTNATDFDRLVVWTYAL
jgi:hypothetical protein